MEALDFYSFIRNQVFSAISESPRKLVLWGFNEHCVKLMGELRLSGQVSCVAGIVDPDVSKCGAECEGVVVRLASDISQFDVNTFVVLEDADKETVLRSISQMVPGLPNIILSGSAHLEFRDPLFDMILSECSITPKAGGYPYILKHIFQCLKHLAQSNRQGAIAEFGAFQCGTTVFMAKVLQRFGSTATIYAFDTFAGFPHRRSVLDLFVDEKYAANDLERTLAYCRDYNIVLVPGDISETYLSIKAIPLMFTFFDTDNYSPTKVALKLCYEQTVEGGMIAFDHYYSPDWPQTVGERIAAKDILADTNLFHLHGTGIFLKT